MRWPCLAIIGARLASFERSHLAIEQRFASVKMTVALGFLAGLYLSRHLWLTARNFPLVPVIAGLPSIPTPWDYAVLACLGLLLALTLSSERPGNYIFAFLAMIFVLGILDQNRWQPWAYEYCLILATFGIFYARGGHKDDQEYVLNMCRLIVACIYFYSGLQKLNPTFSTYGFAELFGLGSRTPGAYLLLSGLPGLVEASLGVGLLIGRVRNLAVMGAAGMHLFILYSIGPFGRNWNSVVWPWNLAEIALLFSLFWKAEFSLPDVLWHNCFAFQKVLLLMVLVLPAFSFLGWWDSYLSWSLYSGNVAVSNIFVGDRVAHQLPAYLRRYITHVSPNNNQLTIRDWSMGELNVPTYPEPRIYRALGADVCRRTQNSPDIALYVRGRQTLWGGGQIDRNTCLGTLVVH